MATNDQVKHSSRGHAVSTKNKTSLVDVWQATCQVRLTKPVKIAYFRAATRFHPSDIVPLCTHVDDTHLEYLYEAFGVQPIDDDIEINAFLERTKWSMAQVVSVRTVLADVNLRAVYDALSMETIEGVKVDTFLSNSKWSLEQLVALRTLVPD